jgi:NTE family protein
MSGRAFMRLLLLLAFTAGAALVPGAPSAQDQAPAQATPPRPKVGLALSGGGARGLAHIGVLKVLEELGVPVDMIAGTSMGSIVGGFYAAGYTPEQIRAMVSEVDWAEAFSSRPERKLLRLDQKDESQRYLFEVGLGQGAINLPAGLLSGYKLTTLLTRHCLPVAHLEDFSRLPIPFRAVATDITNGETVILGKGNLAQSMRASMSIPSVFPPFEIEGRLLVDGGITQNLPVQTVRDMGADVVIAVNVSTPLRPRAKINDFIDVMDQTISLAMIRNTEQQAALADFLITPELDKFSNTDFDKGEVLLRIGEEAARQQSHAILALAQARGIELAQRRSSGVAPVVEVVVSKVTLEGSQIYLSELARLAPYKEGQRVTTQELDQSVQRLYGLGTLENVCYQVIPTADGRSEVCYAIQEKNLGLAGGRMGLKLGLNSQGSEDWGINFNFRRPNVLFSGSSAELNLMIGRSYGVEGRLSVPNQPLDGVFFRPSFFYYSLLHDIYSSRELRAQFTLERTGVSLEAGYYLGTAGEFTVGYLLEYDAASPRIMTTSFDEIGDRLSGIRSSLKFDTLDKKPFPTRGFTSLMTLQRMLRDMYSEVDYSRVEWSGSVAVTPWPRHTLEPNWSLVSSLNTAPPLTQVVFLGGYPGMLGYAFEEFYGNDMARLQLLYRYKLTDHIYLQAAGNVGYIWNSLDEWEGTWDRMRWGGGGGVAFDTPMGPLALTLGFGEQGRTNFYFNFGYGF